MDEILRYVSLITLSGAAISFVIGLIKWIDQRNREQRQKEYEAFHRMISLASGAGESGGRKTIAQQVAAIYQLQMYKRYAFASIPVLELVQSDFSKQKKSVPTEHFEHVEKALSETIGVLSKYSGRSSP